MIGTIAFAMPPRCLFGDGATGKCAVETTAPAADAPQEAARAARPQPFAVAAEAPLPAAASVHQGAPAPAAAAVLAATFDALQSAPDNSKLNAGFAVPDAPAAQAPAPTQVASAYAPTTRLVSTTVVRANYDAPVEEIAPPVANADAVAPVDPVAAAATPEPAAADAPIPLARTDRPGGTASTSTASGLVVGGSGVVVRAGPSKSRGKLFTLAAGQKLTLVSKERGWLHIKDSRGRDGWVYSDFVTSKG